MNITAELIDLYATAKTAEKLDLAFRILACLTKIKPDGVSLAMLSQDDMTSIITECDALSPDKLTKTDLDCHTSKGLAMTQKK